MEEKKEKGRGQQRLVRLVVISLAAVLVVLLSKGMVSQPNGFKTKGVKLNLQSLPLEKYVPEKVLNKVKTALGQKESEPETEEADQSDGETEPIAEPAENIQKQSQKLLDLIKKLPDDQLAAVKKQLCKELCEE